MRYQKECLILVYDCTLYLTDSKCLCELAPSFLITPERIRETLFPINTMISSQINVAIGPEKHVWRRQCRELLLTNNVAVDAEQTFSEFVKFRNTYSRMSKPPGAVVHTLPSSSMSSPSGKPWPVNLPVKSANTRCSDREPSGWMSHSHHSQRVWLQ